jgi:hypothetical protein
MNRVLMTLALALALVLLPLAPCVQGQPQSNDLATTAKVKAEVAKRGTGEKARVTIKLRDGSELKGRITQASDTLFTLADEKSGSETDIAYSDVAKVKGRGGLSKGAKFGIIAAVVGGAVIVAGIISVKNIDPFKNGVLR